MTSPGAATIPARETDVDDVALAGGPHRAQRGDRAVDQAGDVDIEHRLPQLGALLPRRAAVEDAGVVDPEVERAGAADRLGEPAAGGLVADVEGGAAGLGSELGGDPVGRPGVDVGDVDAVAAPIISARSRGRGRCRRRLPPPFACPPPYPSALGRTGRPSYHRRAG